jgi:hypothetical protein
MPKGFSKTRELGTRKVTTMNYSRFITLPPEFVRQLDDLRSVRVAMTEKGELVLTPMGEAEEIRK